MHRGLFTARDLGESGWSHDFLPVCDLETCADLGLTNDYLLNLVSFGMDQDGKVLYIVEYTSKLLNLDYPNHDGKGLFFALVIVDKEPHLYKLCG